MHYITHMHITQDVFINNNNNTYKYYYLCTVVVHYSAVILKIYNYMQQNKL